MAAGATYTPIFSTTLSSTQANVTFSTIPSTYTDLVLIINANCATAGQTYANIQLQFNGDSATNYSYTQVYGDGSAAYSDRGSANTGIFAGYYNSTASIYSNLICSFNNYSNTSTYKTALIRQNYGTRGTTTTNVSGANVGLWRSTSAINQINIGGSGSFSTGSTFTLYGIASA